MSLVAVEHRACGGALQNAAQLWSCLFVTGGAQGNG